MPHRPGSWRVYVGQRLITPPSIQREYTLLGFILARMQWGNVDQVYRENVGNQDFRGMTAAGAIGLVLVCEVLAESALGAFATGVTIVTTRDAAGQATGAQLIAKLPAGEYFKPLGGNWTKK